MQQVYTNKMLYTQLAYYKYLFDVLHCLSQVSCPGCRLVCFKLMVVCSSSRARKHKLRRQP